VIRDLNLEIRDQEFLVLVGPSGCGKSTALRMIAGLEEITEGELFIGDRVVNDVAPKDRDIAMVFQNYALYPHMTVFDNLAFGLKLRHTAQEEIQRRVQQAAEILGIGEYLQRKPRELSGGQRQRVALGRAIVREPKVFLMDEPLSNLDAKLRVATRAEITRLHQRVHTTFVYVTHDQVEAMTMGDRIAVLNAGVIQQLGTPQDLYDTPSNLFVAGFIGSPAMNFFTAKLKKGADGAAPTLIINDGATPQTLTLSGHAAEAVGGQATAEGRDVVVGIRPEDMRAGAGDGADGATIKGTVDVVEHLGNEQLVYMQVPGAFHPEGTESHAVTARADSRAVIRTGDTIGLVVDTSKAHVFDPQTTKAFV
ncbi:MAG TPA: sn-glycerol-3-phosphate ABC transporter ATP-binding protein UgpC, partial [Ktedonobacterales bacterium]